MPSALSFKSVSENDKILDLARYNGRVNLVELPSPEVQFQLFERVSIKNKATDYRGVLGNEFENNMLSEVFFCAGNMQIIQNGIRAGVYEMSNQKITIPPQNPDTIHTIMRSIYMQYGRHGTSNIREEVARLNDKVLEYAVPNTFNTAVSQLKYMRDASTLVSPMERPIQVDRSFKQLGGARFFE
jgi:hypothetical protein